METPQKSITEEKNIDLTLNENAAEASEISVNQVEADEVAGADELAGASADEAVANAVDDAVAEAADTVAEGAEDSEDVASEAKTQRFTTSSEVIVALTELSQREPDEISRDEISRLKQIFFTIRKSETRSAINERIAAGDDPFAINPDEHADEQVDTLFRALIEQIKEKKTARAAEVEAEMQRNLEAKDALIAEIATLAEDADNVNKHFNRFREIQAEFKAVGEIDPRYTTDRWKRYQDAVERFYDQLKINQELRDYDFKKNLESKLQLCERAEQLVEVADVVASFKQLQDLHDEWRQTGPVAKEMREEIWNRFKEASAAVNKAYQAYFEARKQRETDNEAAKTALCERIEGIDLDEIKGFNAWNEATAVVLAAQEEWKSLGFASKKVNAQLFARFREACDKFFETKANYYKSVKEDLAANLAAKIALCEQAEALKDSTDWKATANKLTELQHRWREIGAVPKKSSETVWRRFQAACDYFFEQRKRDLNSSRHAEQANLKAKRQLVSEMQNLDASLNREQVIAAIKDARARWQQIGHVPFKEKDAVYAEFSAAIDALFANRDLRGKADNMARFESSIDKMDDGAKLSRERERLARVLEQKRAELQAYENNLGFFNFKSSAGSSMLRDIERKQQRIREDIEELTNKIALIDSRR